MKDFFTFEFCFLFHFDATLEWKTTSKITNTDHCNESHINLGLLKIYLNSSSSNVLYSIHGLKIPQTS